MQNSILSHKYISNKYYILYLRDITNIRALPYYFPNISLAQYALDKINSKGERALFKIVSGKYIKKYMPTIYKKLKLKPSKYRYPGDLVTKQQRKNFRTMARRRLRRMDLLTKNNRAWAIRPEPRDRSIRRVKNKQKVADSPNTTVRVVQLAKYNNHVYLLVNQVLEPKRGKDLCQLDCYKVNMKKRTCRLSTVRVQNKDIITALDLKAFKQKETIYNYKLPEEVWTVITSSKLKKLGKK